MNFITESSKTFEKACQDLEMAAKNNNFGILYVHSLGDILRGKGFDFKENCKVFEICSPEPAFKVLQTQMDLNLALPCRISVYTEKGRTKIGFIRPTKIISGISSDLNLAVIAHDVEDTMLKIVNDAK